VCRFILLYTILLCKCACCLTAHIVSPIFFLESRLILHQNHNFLAILMSLSLQVDHALNDVARGYVRKRGVAARQNKGHIGQLMGHPDSSLIFLMLVRFIVVVLGFFGRPCHNTWGWPLVSKHLMSHCFVCYRPIIQVLWSLVRETEDDEKTIRLAPMEVS
jgi:hypothetical protein